MAVGYRRAGVDLDSIFALYITGTKKPNVGLRVGGVDISQRYQPYVDGPLAAATGYRFGGADLNTLYAPIGWTPNVPLGFDGGSYLHSREGPVTCRISLTLLNNGTWQVFGGPGSLKASGPWLSVLGGGSVSDYEVIYSAVEASGPVSIINGAVSYSNLSTNRSIAAEVSGTDEYGAIFATCRVRHIPTGVVKTVSTCELTAEILSF